VVTQGTGVAVTTFLNPIDPDEPKTLKRTGTNETELD
jgi:hypothetical protein